MEQYYNDKKENNSFGFLKMTSVGLGFLLALSFFGFWHEISETSFSKESIIFSLLAIASGLFVGKILAKHLSVCSHEHIDSPKDAGFLFLIVLGSLVHTIFDGSILHEGFSHSIQEGFIFLFAILGHEFVRTTILYKILRTMSFPKVVAGFSVFGISVLGILGGLFLSLIFSFEEYEGLAHIISGGLFVAVATDLYYYLKFHGGKIKWNFVFLGIIIVYIIQFFHIGH